MPILLREGYFMKTKSKSRIVVDCLIANLKEKTLLVQQRSGTRKLFPYFWDFIGGHLENDESIEECIRREVFEEAKMRLVRVIAQVHEFTWAYDDCDVVDKVYMIIAEGEFRLEKGKAIAARWITRSDASLLLKPGETDNDMYQAILKAFDVLDTFN
jgi:8-oxo-dGTP diphosphatase